jgi:hypothetical protein
MLFVDADRRYLWFRPTLARTHILSLCYLALPSSIYKALRRRNQGQSKYTFLRIQFYHFKGSTSTKLVSPVWDEKVFVKTLSKREGNKNVL